MHKLITSIVHSRDCFVSIPAGLFPSPTTSTGPLTLRLEWGSETGNYTRAWVGWGGKVTQPSSGSNTSNRIGIPDRLAECLSLPEQTHVDVRLEADPVVSSMVHVEPASADDWEMLELNANFVECNLLSQISVMTEGVSFPFWINKSVIYLKLVSIDGNPASAANVFFSNTNKGISTTATLVDLILSLPPKVFF